MHYLLVLKWNGEKKIVFQINIPQGLFYFLLFSWGFVKWRESHLGLEYKCGANIF
jgi:hypothetical protein